MREGKDVEWLEEGGKGLWMVGGREKIRNSKDLKKCCSF
jgi:hypothetical protein